MRNIIQGIEATRLLADAQGDVPAPVEEPNTYVVMWRVVTRPGNPLPRLVPTGR